MALYNSGTLIADVALTDTFNTWRTRFNNAIADAASTTANNTFTVTHTFNPPNSGPGNGITLQNNGSYNTSFDVSANTLGGTLTTSAQAGITSVGTLTALSIDQGVLATDGPVTAPIVTANTLGGTLSTAAQPNITSVGTLSSLTVTGTINGSGDLDLGDSDKILLGAGDDLEIYHDGSNSYFKNNTGVMRIHGTEVQIKDEDNNETLAIFTPQGAVTLYYDNASKLATKSDGVDITGELQSDSLDVDGNGDISGNLVVGGNLNVNGTTTTVATTNMVVADNLIELNNGAGSNANDSGIVIERGSTGDNAFIGWDESADRFIVGTTTATGASTGNLSITKGTINADLAGDVTGDVTGNVTGDVTGNVTGNVTGSVAGTNTVAVNRASVASNSKLDINGATVHPVNAVGASTIDVSLGGIYTKTAAGAITWVFSNVPASRAVGFVLKLTNGGDHTMTWPASVDWPGGAAPAHTSSGTDILVFITHDGGTTWYGNQAMTGVA
jgi:hypothetical protein